MNLLTVKLQSTNETMSDQSSSGDEEEPSTEATSAAAEDDGYQEDYIQAESVFGDFNTTNSSNEDDNEEEYLEPCYHLVSWHDMDPEDHTQSIFVSIEPRAATVEGMCELSEKLHVYQEGSGFHQATNKICLRFTRRQQFVNRAAFQAMIDHVFTEHSIAVLNLLGTDLDISTEIVPILQKALQGRDSLVQLEIPSSHGILDAMVETVQHHGAPLALSALILHHEGEVTSNESIHALMDFVDQVSGSLQFLSLNLGEMMDHHLESLIRNLLSSNFNQPHPQTRFLEFCNGAWTDSSLTQLHNLWRNFYGPGFSLKLAFGNCDALFLEEDDIQTFMTDLAEYPAPIHLYLDDVDALIADRILSAYAERRNEFQIGDIEMHGRGLLADDSPCLSKLIAALPDIRARSLIIEDPNNMEQTDEISEHKKRQLEAALFRNGTLVEMKLKLDYSDNITEEMNDILWRNQAIPKVKSFVSSERGLNCTLPSLTAPNWLRALGHFAERRHGASPVHVLIRDSVGLWLQEWKRQGRKRRAGTSDEE